MLQSKAQPSIVGPYISSREIHRKLSNSLNITLQVMKYQLVDVPWRKMKMVAEERAPGQIPG
jgi:hypothetical protein